MAVYDRHAYKNSEAVSAYLCFGNFVGVVKTLLFERSVRFKFYVKKSTCPYGHCFVPIAY